MENTKTRTKYYDTILLFLFFLALFFVIDLMAAPSPILIHGHRGARAMRSENTLKAFQYALDNDIDVLEMDMAVTSDNVIVISHEPHINTELCLDSQGNRVLQEIAIHSLSLAQVKSYDCGTIKNPKFASQITSPKERIPTLEEVFELIEKSDNPFAKKIQFNIETKIYPNHPDLSPNPEEFVQDFYSLVKKHKMGPRVILQSFDDRTLIEMKKVDPKIRTAQLTSDNHIDYVTIAKTSHADIISPDWGWILPDDVKRLHKIKVQVAPWTPDSQEAWEKLINMNVDAIITDDPKGLKDYMSGRSTDGEKKLPLANPKSNSQPGK